MAHSKNYTPKTPFQGLNIDIVTLDGKGGLQIVGTQFIHDKTKDPIVMHPKPIPISTELALKRAKESNFIAIVLSKIHPDYLNIGPKNPVDFRSVAEIPATLCERMIELGEECRNNHIFINDGFDFDLFQRSYEVIQSKHSKLETNDSDRFANTATNIDAMIQSLSDAELSVENLKSLNKIFVAMNLLLGSKAALTKTPDNLEALAETVSTQASEMITRFNEHKNKNPAALAKICSHLDELVKNAKKVLEGEKISINPADYKKWAISTSQKRG